MIISINEGDRIQCRRHDNRYLASFSVKNHSNNTVAFKIKTTANKTVKIQSHQGCIRPQQVQQFQVEIERMNQNPKIQVQAIKLPEGYTPTTDQIKGLFLNTSASHQIVDLKAELVLQNSFLSNSQRSLESEIPSGYFMRSGPTQMQSDLQLTDELARAQSEQLYIPQGFSQIRFDLSNDSHDQRPPLMQVRAPQNEDQQRNLRILEQEFVKTEKEVGNLEQLKRRLLQQQDQHFYQGNEPKFSQQQVFILAIVSFLIGYWFGQ